MSKLQLALSILVLVGTQSWAEQVVDVVQAQTLEQGFALERSAQVLAKFDSLVSSRTAGSLIYVARRGSFVANGEVLASIDSSHLQTRLESLFLLRQRIEKLVDLRSTQVSRKNAMFTKGSLSREALVQEEIALREEEVELERVNATIVEVQTEIADSHVRAPFNGTVIERFQEVGEQTGPSKALLRLASADEKMIDLNIEPEFINLIDPTIEVRTRSGTVGTAQIRSIVRGIDPDTRLVPMRATITPTLNKQVLVGDRVSIKVAINIPNWVTAIVPSTSVIFQQGPGSNIRDGS